MRCAVRQFRPGVKQGAPLTYSRHKATLFATLPYPSFTPSISLKMVEIQAQTPKGGRFSSVDHLPQSTVHSTSSPPPKNLVSDILLNNSSQPPSRSSSPLPYKALNSRHIQRTIDNYFQPPSSLDGTNQLYEEAGMHSDDVSTPTQSTAPSECDSQESERSSRGLRAPEQKKRRTSTNRRAVGERDDGLCSLPSPPPSLCTSLAVNNSDVKLINFTSASNHILEEHPQISSWRSTVFPVHTPHSQLHLGGSRPGIIRTKWRQLCSMH